MESVIISPGNYTYKKKVVSNNHGHTSAGCRAQNLQEERIEILKSLVPPCLHIKPAPKSEVEYYYQKASVFDLYICGLLVMSMEC